MKQAISTTDSNSILSPKQAKHIVLVPNRDVLQQQMARTMIFCEDDDVCIAPALYIFSSWIESLAVRLRMLNGEQVPANLDTWSGLLTWAAHTAGKIDNEGHAFAIAAARQARDADRLLRQWLNEEDIPWLDERFFAIRSATRRAFDSLGVFSAEDWIQDLTSRLNGGITVPVALPEQIDLVGFIELTDQESRLLQALEGQGVTVKQAVSGVPASVQVTEYPTPEDEWQAAAGWAKSKLNAGAQRLAIVLPPESSNPGPDSQRFRDMLSAVFHPREAARLEDDAIQDFFIPGASSLADSNAVADAILLLTLTLSGVDGKLGFPQLSRWLLSPHWFESESEAESRARLEIRLRKTGVHEISLTGLRRLAVSDEFDNTLSGLAEKVTDLPAIDRAPGVGSCFHEVLSYWGWPGTCGNESLAREVDQFASLLERLDTMKFDSTQQALATLVMMVGGTRLSLGGGPLSPVQVLTPEVAASGHFDAAWVCGMDGANWPPPISANPYVPATARARIPRMNPAGQHAYFRTLTQLLSHCADEVHFSWSLDGGQGERNQSGLISEFDSQKREAVIPTNLASATWAHAGIALSDNDGRLLAEPDGTPGLPIADAKVLPGGSGFFRLQAASPMLGYLRYRLAADFPEPPSALANPQFRGELLHQALRELYRQTVITGTKPGTDEIPASVEAALIRLRARDRLTHSAYLAERERLRGLLNEWLALDYSRQGFVVEAVEDGRRLKCGESEISIRFDRLDRMADGSFFVLDYKSGGANTRALKWTNPRMQEPQLPLYAVLLEDSGEVGPTGGIAFAIVKRGNCAFDGITGAVDGEQARGIRKPGTHSLKDWDWPSLMVHWRSQIEMLREEILTGRADNCIYDQLIVEQSGLELILRYSQAGPDDEGGDNAAA